MQSIKLIILLVLFASASFADDKAPTPSPSPTSDKPTYVLCRNQKNVRTIHIDKVGEVYVVSYTRLGIDKEVGRGRSFDSLSKIMQNVKANLEKSNWKCKELSNVTSTIGK